MPAAAPTLARTPAPTRPAGQVAVVAGPGVPAPGPGSGFFGPGGYGGWPVGSAALQPWATAWSPFALQPAAPASPYFPTLGIAAGLPWYPPQALAQTAIETTSGALVPAGQALPPLPAMTPAQQFACAGQLEQVRAAQDALTRVRITNVDAFGPSVPTEVWTTYPDHHRVAASTGAPPGELMTHEGQPGSIGAPRWDRWCGLAPDQKLAVIAGAMPVPGHVGWPAGHNQILSFGLAPGDTFASVVARLDAECARRQAALGHAQDALNACLASVAAQQTNATINARPAYVAPGVAKTMGVSPFALRPARFGNAGQMMVPGYGAVLAPLAPLAYAAPAVPVVAVPAPLGGAQVDPAAVLRAMNYGCAQWRQSRQHDGPVLAQAMASYLRTQGIGAPAAVQDALAVVDAYCARVTSRTVAMTARLGWNGAGQAAMLPPTGVPAGFDPTGLLNALPNGCADWARRGRAAQAYAIYAQTQRAAGQPVRPFAALTAAERAALQSGLAGALAVMDARCAAAMGYAPAGQVMAAVGWVPSTTTYYTFATDAAGNQVSLDAYGHPISGTVVGPVGFSSTGGGALSTTGETSGVATGGAALADSAWTGQVVSVGGESPSFYQGPNVPVTVGAPAGGGALPLGGGVRPAAPVASSLIPGVSNLVLGLSAAAFAVVGTGIYLATSPPAVASRPGRAGNVRRNPWRAVAGESEGVRDNPARRSARRRGLSR